MPSFRSFHSPALNHFALKLLSQVGFESYHLIIMFGLHVFCLSVLEQLQHHQGGSNEVSRSDGHQGNLRACGTEPSTADERRARTQSQQRTEALGEASRQGLNASSNMALFQHQPSTKPR